MRDEWFEFAERDLISAKILFNNNGPTSTIGICLQQAVEKYLKGFLIANGWRLIKTHDIPMLLTEAAKHDKYFEEFIDFGRGLSELYVEDRYPGIAMEQPSREKMREMIEVGDKIIGLLKRATND